MSMCQIVNYQMYSDFGNQRIQNLINQVRAVVIHPVDQYRLVYEALLAMQNDHRLREVLDNPVRFAIMEVLWQQGYSRASFDEMFKVFIELE